MTRSLRVRDSKSPMQPAGSNHLEAKREALRGGGEDRPPSLSRNTTPARVADILVFTGTAGLDSTTTPAVGSRASTAATTADAPRPDPPSPRKKSPGCSNTQRRLSSQTQDTPLSQLTTRRRAQGRPAVRLEASYAALPTSPRPSPQERRMRGRGDGGREGGGRGEKGGPNLTRSRSSIPGGL